jgi:chemotaxis signal transduction protein
VAIALWVYHLRVHSLAAERKALLFSVGGVRLALRLAQVREILEVGPGGGDVVARGESYPVAFVATVLGLHGGDAPYALLTEANPRAALRVDRVHGIVDLVDAEVFQIPARTRLPQPPPFAGAIVARGELSLELAAPAIGWEPLPPATDALEPPVDAGPTGERELVFARGERRYGVPMSNVVRIIERPRIAPVPLTSPSNLGLLYHARTLHPVVDIAVLQGEQPAREVVRAIIIDAGGAEVALVADRVERVGAMPDSSDVLRPAWDTLLGG